MTPDTLKPGDRVLELAALAQATAVATGAVCAAWLIWKVKGSWPASCGAFLAGAALGFIVAQGVARLLYWDAEGTHVVKLGPGALGAAVRAGLAGALPTAAAVALILILAFGQPASLLVAALCCGAVIGIVIAAMGALL